MPAVDLTARLARESRPTAKDTILFDEKLPGFGLRIHPSGRKVWIVQTRIGGRSRRMVIARRGEMELAEARRRARDILHRTHTGANPADDIQKEKRTPTLRKFTREYLQRSEPHWKPSGCTTVRIYLKARILPTFGSMPLDRIGPEDVAAWFDAASRDRPGAANRALEILRAMLFRAEEWGRRERGTNPCLGIRHNPRCRIARFLDTDELARLGRALDAREAEWPEEVHAIRLLALTDCRRGEVLNLRWRDISDDALNLADSKTGPRAVPLGEAARAHIKALPGRRDPDAYLFPRYAGKRMPVTLIDRWRAICSDAQIGRLRLPDLRHTAARQAVMSGEGLSQVGKLLGHRRHRTTANYAHLADAHLVTAAEKVGHIVARAMRLSNVAEP
ncbi:MAG: tyrosine-type recombinase/integrase [Rhodospirillales bacterium]|nr:tyrosine-type recombinase/integrase [Rhodospirillales bacterium]